MLCVCELTGWNLDSWTTFAAGHRFALMLGHHCASQTHSISPSIHTALVVVSLHVVPGCAPFRLFINLIILPLHLYWVQIAKFINWHIHLVPFLFLVSFLLWFYHPHIYLCLM